MTIPQQLRRGLVAYWPLDESSGGTSSALYDAGGPYDLADNNTVTSGTGPSDNVPNARDFEADTSEYFSIADKTSFTLSGAPFSVAMWVNLESKSGLRTAIGQYDIGNGQRSWVLLYTNSSDRFQWTVSSTGSNVNTAEANTFGSPSVATWYFIVCDFDGSLARIRVNNGGADTATSSGLHDSTADLLIGAQLNSGSPLRFWDGQLAQPVIWRRLLSEAEIQWLYNNGNGRDLLRGV